MVRWTPTFIQLVLFNLVHERPIALFGERLDLELHFAGAQAVGQGLTIQVVGRDLEGLTWGWQGITLVGGG